MDLEAPTPLLGGLAPAAFMRRHWQKKPLVVRGALPGIAPPLARPALFDLAAHEDVESRLVRRDGDAWTLRRGPLPRRALPPLSRPQWTLLVQGLDLHVPAAHALLQRFAFVPAARLDDLMVSWASEGGGVGPHVDAYDVFLVQIEGRRRWRVAPPGDAAFVEGLPLKILRRFEPVHEWVLEPGDLLYLPPLWGHDGVAVDGPCMTASAGFRAPDAAGLARELLQRCADAADDALPPTVYRDRRQPATANPGAIPSALGAFAAHALQRVLASPHAVERALGEALSEPKPQVWFDPGRAPKGDEAVALDARSRMLYDARHVYLNGEAYVARGRDAALMRRLADRRRLDAADVARLGTGARELLDAWARDGWVRPAKEAP